MVHRRLLQTSPSPAPSSIPSPSPLVSPKRQGERAVPSSPSPHLAPASSPTKTVSPPSHSAQQPPPSESPTIVPPKQKSTSSHLKNLDVILVGAIGGAILISIIGVYLCKSNKVATVKPWATGLSGQLQKAFVTGMSSYSLGRKAEKKYIILDIFVSFGLPSHL